MLKLFRFVTGILAWEKRLVFERVIWRACHRAAFVRHAAIDELLEDPITVEFRIVKSSVEITHW